MSSPASIGVSAVGRVDARRGLRRLAAGCVLITLYALAASSVLADFISYPGMNRSAVEVGGEDFFGDMIYGRASQPYVGRVLLPWLVRGTAAVLPRTAARRIADRVRYLYVRDSEPRWLDHWALEFELTRVWLFGFLLAFAWALRRLARAAGLSRLHADIVPLVGLGFVPVLFGYVSHLYDLPGLALFTLGLVFIAEQRLFLYSTAFALACLNKETAILLSLVWLGVSWHRLERRRLVVLLLVQIGMWLVARGVLVALFASNPGSVISLRLERNLAVLAEPRAYLMFRPVSNWLVLPTGLNIVTVGLYLLGLAGLRHLPRLFRYCYLLAVPMVLLSLLFGNIDEMRVYYELLPAAIVAGSAALYQVLGYDADESPPVRAGQPLD